MDVYRHTESTDDYLKAILELGGAGLGPVAGKPLAQHLGVRAASVTNMLQKLARVRPPLVHYIKQHGVLLTAAGRKRALEVLRHHRLLERFLHDVLEYRWDEVHEEAERLEHFISERMEDRMAAKLGNPAVDPHGHLIPARSGRVPPRNEVALSRWACGVPAVVSSVADHDPAALRHMKRLGICPGIQLTVQEGPRRDGLRVRIGRRRRAVLLSYELSAAISLRSDGQSPA